MIGGRRSRTWCTGKGSHNLRAAHPALAGPALRNRLERSVKLLAGRQVPPPLFTHQKKDLPMVPAQDRCSSDDRNHRDPPRLAVCNDRSRSRNSGFHFLRSLQPTLPTGRKRSNAPKPPVGRLQGQRSGYPRSRFYGFAIANTTDPEVARGRFAPSKIRAWLWRLQRRLGARQMVIHSPYQQLDGIPPLQFHPAGIWWTVEKTIEAHDVQKVLGPALKVGGEPMA